MSDDNKKNILYFESQSMHDLYETMEEWQNTNQKRFLSMDIQNDGGKFCCIALTNPTEVVIVDKMGAYSADVNSGTLLVTILNDLSRGP